MSLLFNSEGYFCEGEIGKKWQFHMEFGKILLTNSELSLIKRSNISLTEIGVPIDNFNEGYKIPLSKIRKVYNIKNQKLHVVKVETRDDHLFSITMANEKSNGRKKSIELSETINATILQNL